MEILCIQGTKDQLLLNTLVPLVSNPPTVTEISVFKLATYGQNFAFFSWPVLKINDKPKFYGIRSILQYLFSGKEQLPVDQLNQIDTMITLADSIYSAAIPQIAKNQSILIKDELITESHAKLNEYLPKAQAFLASNGKTVGHIYLQNTLNVIGTLGISVAPATSTEVSNDGLSDEAIRYAHETLGIPERYEMSPAPSKEMYFSTPIYYVNGVPHIGHVFTTALVESLTKWYKLRGIPIIYSSGTDEHGMKVQTTAASKGVSPIEWCNKTSSEFQAAFDQFDLHPDVFIRTTEKRHEEVASTLWKILAQKGFIYEGKYEGWYSKTEEAFIPENQITEVVKDGVTKKINSEDGAELIWSSETNYMFKLSAMEQPLLDWLAANPNVITPRCYYNQVVSTIKAGLRDLSVSRQNVTWGIPVPGDEGQTMYVWIDALANYLTVAGWNGESNGIWPADLHTVGKDILRFHAIYWPAFLIAADVQPYKRLLVHGWWTMDEKKMSKSIGNTLDPVVLSNYWGLESVKYFLLREATLVSDADYSDLAMRNRHNNDLCNVLGNMVMRVTSSKLLPGMVVPEHSELTPEDQALIESAEALPGTVDHHVAFGRTRLALDAIWNLFRDVNKYITDQAPWTVIRTDPVRGKTISYVCLEVLRIGALCLWPFMSQTANKILSGIGYTEKLEPSVMFKFGGLKPGTPVHEVTKLFERKPEDKA